jgi:hypothetical protein
VSTTKKRNQIVASAADSEPDVCWGPDGIDDWGWQVQETAPTPRVDTYDTPKELIPHV